MFLIRPQLGFTVSKPDRGKAEHEKFAVSISMSALNTDAAIPDRAKHVAGTDPHDPNSVLKLSTDVRLSPQGGLIIQWSSVPDKAIRAISLHQVRSQWILHGKEKEKRAFRTNVETNLRGARSKGGRALWLAKRITWVNPRKWCWRGGCVRKIYDLV